jgi:predicted dithiol-disulfide oxidoreductase (DUF899 family)
MVEVDGATPLIGERGAVTILDAFEGRRMLIAYRFMWHTGHMESSYRLLDLTVYGRQETWEDSATGWPQTGVMDFLRGYDAETVFKGKKNTRTDRRPTAQWSRLKAGHSDDLGTASR